MTCGRRRYRSGILEAMAECDDCEFLVEAKTAIGLAAIHHDKTGHKVRAHQTVGIVYAMPEVLDAMEKELHG